MKIVRWLCVGSVLLLAACGGRSESPQRMNETDAQVIAMSEPAAQNCAKAGGRLALAWQLNGNSVGMCQLPNGKQCEEWALEHGTCPR